MAFGLDKVKADTTWNDAAGSINNNFSKVKIALALIGSGEDIDGIAELLEEYATKEMVEQKEAELKGAMAQMEQRLTEMEQATIQPLYEKQ